MGNTALYSTQLRYGLWKNVCGRHGCKISTGRFFRKPDCVVFQKSFSDDHRRYAADCRRSGIRVVFDINVNYFEFDKPLPGFQTRQQQEDAWKMVELADVVTTTSDYITAVVSSRHGNVHTVHEPIDVDLWHSPRRHAGPVRSVMLCSTFKKIGSLLLIQPFLESIAARDSVKLVLVSDHRGELEIGIPQEWRIWEPAGGPGLFEGVDLQLAPRDLSYPYNRGHSLTKVGLGMASGLPAIGSPVPVYADSPCLTADSLDAWFAHYESLRDPGRRQALADEGAQWILEERDPSKLFERFLECLS